jgi:hypothetical protein
MRKKIIANGYDNIKKLEETVSTFLNKNKNNVFHQEDSLLEILNIAREIIHVFVNKYNNEDFYSILVENQFLSKETANSLENALRFVEISADVLSSEKSKSYRDMVAENIYYMASKTKKEINFFKQNKFKAVWSRFLFFTDDNGNYLNQNIVDALIAGNNLTGFSPKELNNHYFEQIDVIKNSFMFLVDILQGIDLSAKYHEKTEATHPLVIIQESLENNYFFSPSLYFEIKENVSNMKLTENDYQLFLELLTWADENNKIYDFYRLLKDIGFLTKAFSQTNNNNDNVGWAPINNQIHINMFHNYNVGEHILQVIKGLETMLDFAKIRPVVPTDIKLEDFLFSNTRSEDFVSSPAYSLIKLSGLLIDKELYEKFINFETTNFSSNFIYHDEMSYYIVKEASVLLELSKYFTPLLDNQHQRINLYLGLLLHDIGKSIDFNLHDQIGADMVREILLPLNLTPNNIDEIESIIRHHHIKDKKVGDDYNKKKERFLLDYQNGKFELATMFAAFISDYIGCQLRTPPRNFIQEFPNFVLDLE